MFRQICTASLLMCCAAPYARAEGNPNYTRYPGPELIQRDLGDLRRVFRRNYEKFIAYKTPNGGEILLVATDGMSDEQLLRAYNILDFYLTDVPGALFGADKTAVVNTMADNGAVLVMPGGADGDSPISLWALQGQPLYALEFPVEGSQAYITNDYSQRDAGFEEIFHLVHDNGIGTKFTDGALKHSYQAKITKATTHALENGLWASNPDPQQRAETQEWLKELEAEGSLEQEYIASVLDSYYGYWGGWHEASGGMWGIYAAKTRAEVLSKDPQGASLVTDFLSPTVTYMARIDPGFQGVFEMQFDPEIPYTHKSQYLVKARLLGDHPSGLAGNAHDNILLGNAGDNLIDGRDGVDVVQYDFAFADAQITSQGDRLTVTGPDSGTDTLHNIEILRFTDRDAPVVSLGK
ncbi:MAG: hypothetical protein N4A70_04795 [Pelagimonas sp.]|nr:hypothetical protein [Pelagimonas sp.]